MKQAVDRAFELQPDMPEARLALANYYYRGFYDYPRALEQLERVRTVIPNDTIMLHLLALTYRRLGRYEESIDTFLQAAKIDPAHEATWADALETASCRIPGIQAAWRPPAGLCHQFRGICSRPRWPRSQAQGNTLAGARTKPYSGYDQPGAGQAGQENTASISRNLGRATAAGNLRKSGA